MIITDMAGLIMWINSLPTDCVCTALIAGRCVSGTVAEVWDEGFDRCDYEYRFEINGEPCDEADLYDLVRQVPAAKFAYL